MPKTKKKAVKKTAKKARKPARRVAKKPAVKAIKPLKPIGKVTHFYGNIKVAVVKFSLPPKLGKEVHFKGATTDFRQAISSAQVDHKVVARIPKGKLAGIKVRSKVRQGDKIFAV